MKIKKKKSFFFSVFFVAIFFYSFLFSSAYALQYASIVIDADSGRLFHDKNADVAVYPASLTKMMTLYLLLEALEVRHVHMNTKIKVTKHANAVPNFRLGVKAGESVTIKVALQALMVKSANNMAVAISEYLGGGSEPYFAMLMTKKARLLGMSHTTFKNAWGGPHPQQTTTARDMAILSQALYKRFPKAFHFCGIPQFEHNGYVYKNTNKLLGVIPGVEGIKTGFTRASGHNLSVSAYRNGKRIISVVMGGKSAPWRDQRMTHLIETTYELIEKEKKYPSKNNTFQNSAPVLAMNTTPSSPNSFIGSQPFIERAEHHNRSNETLPSSPSSYAPAVSIPVKYFNNTEPSFNSPSDDYSAHQEKAHTAPAVGQNTHQQAAFTTSADTLLLKKTTWAAQVGAYKRMQDAKSAAAKAQKQLTTPLKRKAKISIDPAQKRRVMYRARLVGFTKEQAQQACKLIQTQGGNCLAMQPYKSKKVYTAMN